MKPNSLLSLLALGAVALACALPTRAQDEEDAPEAPETTTTIPLEPGTPANPPIGPRMPLQAGDVLLEGTIESISFAGHRFTLRATSSTLPDGSQAQLTPPLYKTVFFDSTQLVAAAPYPTDGTPPRLVSAGLLWTRHAVAVTGTDPGLKTTMQARLIELGPVQNALVPGAGLIPKSSSYFSGVREHVAATGLRAAPKLGITSLGGVSARPSNPNSDHPRGLALDFMVGRDAKRGDNVAAWFEANMGMENVAYIIWKDTLVYPGARTNWAALPVDYGPGMTARHMDHVHVSFLEQPLTAGPWLTADLQQRAKLAARGGRSRQTRSKRKRRSTRKVTSARRR